LGINSDFLKYLQKTRIFQKHQSLLSDPSTINLQHQQQMLLQQQHLNNLLLYQQQQSQLQTTNETSNTSITPTTTARLENTENSD